MSAPPRCTSAPLKDVENVIFSRPEPTRAQSYIPEKGLSIMSLVVRLVWRVARTASRTLLFFGSGLFLLPDSRGLVEAVDVISVQPGPSRPVTALRDA